MPNNDLHNNTKEGLVYKFNYHMHPYVSELVKRLLQGSVPTLQAADTAENGVPVLYNDDFATTYHPNEDILDGKPPVKELDFEPNGAYSVYNWELFYHIPLTLAIHLSKNQRFEEAQRWFHYIFDPTDDSGGPTPQRFWKVKYFHEKTDIELIEEVLINLSTGEAPALQETTINSINAWKDNPFRPHVIARYRSTAYMYKAIMAYLDNLIAWGDALFLRDTGEDIDEATILYVLAKNILGPKPQEIPQRGSTRPATYASIRQSIDELGNVLAEDIDVSSASSFRSNVPSNEQYVILSNIGKTLYFCTPRNEKLLSYWDTVEDRLYKIHNSLNIKGVFRQLPLFQPPIDPALLARAAAAGLSVAETISGLNQPLPLVRYRLLVQKATEICQEVKALGNSLLSVMEKEDNEALSLLKSQHERNLLELVESTRYAQWQEAIKNREGLEKSLVIAIQRYVYYERLLGKKGQEIEIPLLDVIDKEQLNRFAFEHEEPEINPRQVEVEISKLLNVLDIVDIDVSRLSMNTPETVALISKAGAIPLDIQTMVLESAGAVTSLIPQFNVHLTPVGVGGVTGFGGHQISTMINMLAGVSRGAANLARSVSDISATIGSHERRIQEWAFQSSMASAEINQIYKQIVAAQIREYIAEKEWHNHQQQIKNAQEIEEFLKGEEVQGHTKTTTKGLYTWMKRETRGLYNQYFQFALSIAKKTERALQHELGKQDTYIGVNYLEGREGLLAGEKLLLDIKRMEMAYYDQNQREYELNKSISLLQVAPQALIQLRSTGKCIVDLPEELFDMGGGEGHYFRRIKTVALSIPAVAGPYTGVNCTLTLLQSSIRTSTNTGDGYKRLSGQDDPRFSDNASATASIVTSTGQNDDGLFESNLNDERYLPFEYAGVISTWQLELPNEFRQFDYNTISDIIMHIGYTARQGGELLQSKAIENLRDVLKNSGNTRLFDLRHEFPTEWNRFIGQPSNPTTGLSFQLKEEHYPFWSKGKVQQDGAEVALFALVGEKAPAVIEVEIKSGNASTSPEAIELVKDEGTYGKEMRVGKYPTNTFATMDTVIISIANPKVIKNLWLAVTWKSAQA